jgi:hypothetical protein
MAKNEPRHVIAPNDATAKSLSEMSRDLHAHMLDHAIAGNHGHVTNTVGGNRAPDSDAALQKNQFIPQRVMAGPSEVSGGSFAPGGASDADYQTSSADSVGDCDSAGPTGY